MANTPSLLDLALQDISTPYLDNALNNPVSTGSEEGLYGSDESLYVQDDAYDMERAAELKKKELYRKGKLKYEQDGSLINDSDAMIRAKEIANKGIQAADWLLEASENVADFGQGRLLDKANIKAEIEGREYNMANKDILGARELGPNATQILAQQYRNAVDDPNAMGGVYTLKKFDGLNPDGTPKYIYKVGYAHDGAAERYKNQWMQDGYEIVDEKRFAGASDWEKKFQATPEALQNRVLDSGWVQDPETGKMISRDVASGVGFGDGYTELYNKDLLGVDIGKTQADYDRNRLKSEAWQNAYKRRPKDSNWIDAMQSSTVNMVADLGDFILDALTPGNNTLLDDWSDSEYTDKYFGFDSAGQAKLMNEALHAFKQGDIANAGVYTAMAAPGLLGQSIPYMIGLSSGGTEAKLALNVAKTAQKIKKAEKLGKSAKTIDAMRKRMHNMKGYEKYKQYEEIPQTLAYVNSLLKDKGLLATHTSMVEEQLDQRVKNKLAAGEDPNLSIPEIAAVWLGMLPGTLLDRFAFTDAIKSTGLNKIVKSAFDLAPQRVKQSLFTKAAKNAGRLAASGAEEAGQEYLQTWSEIFGSSLGVNGQGFMDVLKNEANQNEALMGTIGGLGAGGLTSGIAMTPKMAYEGYKGAKENRERQKRLENIEALATQLDDTDFKMFVNDKESEVRRNEEVLNDIADIEKNIQKADNVQDMLDSNIQFGGLEGTDSTIKSMKELGETIREASRRKLLEEDEAFFNDVAEKIAKGVIENEEVFDTKDGKGKFVSPMAALNLYDILGIDFVDDPEYAGLSNSAREQIVAEKIKALPAEQRYEMFKYAAGKTDTDQLPGANIDMEQGIHLFSDSHLNKKLLAKEKEAFQKDGLKELFAKQFETVRKKAEKEAEAERERIKNYVAAREEAIASGSAVNQYDKSDVNLDEFDKDPKGFVNIIKSFGSKKDIIPKIQKYSSESLLKAARSKNASKAMQGAIREVLASRKKIAETLTGFDQEPVEVSQQLDNIDTRYSKEAFANIDKILEEKEYKYAEERNDAIRFINEAYARGVINEEKRNQYLLDVVNKTSGSQGKEAQKNSAKLKRELNRIDASEMSKKEKVEARRKAIAQYSKNMMPEAGEEKLAEVSQIPKYNTKTFNELRKIASQKEIKYTQDLERALKMVEKAVEAGHITKEQGDTFRRRIEKIGEGANESGDKEKYTKMPENIIKTAEDFKREYEKLLKEQRDTKEAILDTHIDIIHGEQLSEEQMQTLNEAINKMDKINEKVNKYSYFSKQEEIINDIVGEFYQFNEEDATIEDKEEDSNLFNFCR